MGRREFSSFSCVLDHQRAHQRHNNPDSKIHRANMGAIWGRQDPGGLHVGPKNFAIWEYAAYRV